MARNRKDRKSTGGPRRDRAEVRGTVVRVVAERGFCFIQPEALPEGFALELGQGIFMHQSANRGQLPSQGASGVFEIEEGDKGLRVVRVVALDRPSNSSTPDTFIHPYNFVRVPADGLGKAAEVEPFKRGAPAPHDRYDSARYTGWLQCSLETKTWWFIPDPRKQATEDEHKVLGYFTLDLVEKDAWDKDRPEQDRTRPAIPASSLRGMVRSVFEAATLSCFSVFDPGVLDFRVGFDPGYVPGGTDVSSGRGDPSYVPARVIERQDDTASIQILNGCFSGDPGNTLPIALVYAYDPRVKSRNGSTGRSTTLWSQLGGIKEGTPVAALIDTRAKPHTRKRRDGSSFVAYHFREAHVVVLASDAVLLTVGSGQWLVFGYLHRTGPNIENKHHERIFFRTDAPYNNPHSHLPVAERLEAFLADQSPTMEVPADVVRATEESLRGYGERHERELRRAPDVPRPINANAPHPSDFVGWKRVEVGHLYYALIEGNTIVQGLYPIALPRLTHEDSRGSLLHPDFHPCTDPERLCAACRVFGWTRPGENGLAPEAGRVDAIAGHIRFTHGILDGLWGRDERRARLATLAILGSPKPTTTAFYLRPRENYDKARSERWPPVLQTALHENIPLYRRDEASLRGRKFYRHHRNVDPSNYTPAAGGILRPPDDEGRPLRDSQNQTVYLLPPALKLGFRVYFDNLHSEELGALVFALTLRPPDSWGQTAALRHALGHGKPLGLGACEIAVEAIQIDAFDAHDPAHRYAQIPAFGQETGVTGGDAVNLLVPHIEAFGCATQQAEQGEPAVRQVRQDLVEMLRADPPNAPVHYPPDPEGDVAKNYEWFVHNRRANASRQQPKGLGLRLPAPSDERTGATRLRRDPREGRR